MADTTSLQAVINAAGRLVDVDTSGSNVVLFFRSQDDHIEYRVELFPDEFRDHYDSSYDYNRVEWLVERVNL